MRPNEFDIDPENVDPDGLADGNSSAGATVTLDGALTSGGTFTGADSLGRRIVILDLGADDQTGATYTLTGTDSDDKTLVENIAGPGASASVTTTGYFKTVTSIAIASPAAGSTVDIGTVDEVSTKTIPLDWRSTEGAAYAVDITGTIDYTVQETFEDIQFITAPSAGSWHNITALAAKTADLAAQGNAQATAARLIVNSYTDTAEIQLHVSQG